MSFWRIRFITRSYRTLCDAFAILIYEPTCFKNWFYINEIFLNFLKIKVLYDYFKTNSTFGRLMVVQTLQHLLTLHAFQNLCSVGPLHQLRLETLVQHPNYAKWYRITIENEWHIIKPMEIWTQNVINQVTWNVPSRRVVVPPVAIRASLDWPPAIGNFVLTTRCLPISPNVYTFASPMK